MTIGIGLIMVGWKFKERKKAFNFRNNRRCGQFRCLQHYVLSPESSDNILSDDEKKDRY